MQAKILISLLYLSSGSVSSMAGTPTTPDNLSLLTYSTSTAELFWDRSIDSDRIRGYELVTSDGSQWLGDVTSHLDTNLPSNGNRVYQVIAVDAFGNRSVPSVPISLNGVVSESGNESIDSCVSTSSGGSTSCTASSSSQSGTLNQSEIVDVDVVNPPTVQADVQPISGLAIENLRAEIYSETALELFWKKPTGASAGDNFQIHREGQLLDTINGASFFDSNLRSGTSYRYEISHLSNGAVVNSQTIDVRTRGTANSSSSSSSQSDGRHTSNVYGETYSRSAVEIFWDTTADARSFDIYRNGEYIGSFNITSYYDDNLQADTNYRYEIYAGGDENFLLGSVLLRTSR